MLWRTLPKYLKFSSRNGRALVVLEQRRASVGVFIILVVLSIWTNYNTGGILIREENHKNNGNTYVTVRTK